MLEIGHKLACCSVEAFVIMLAVGESLIGVPWSLRRNDAVTGDGLNQPVNPTAAVPLLLCKPCGLRRQPNVEAGEIALEQEIEQFLSSAVIHLVDNFSKVV